MTTALVVLALGPLSRAATDKELLLTFKTSFPNPIWFSNWTNTSEPCDGWTGVYCWDGAVVAM